MSAAFWVCALVTALSALVSLGYSVAALTGSTSSDRTPARYAAARSLALAATALTAVIVRSDHFLESTALAMIIVQAADAVVGALNHDRLKTVGPAATAVANAAALIWLVQH